MQGNIIYMFNDSSLTNFLKHSIPIQSAWGLLYFYIIDFTFTYNIVVYRNKSHRFISLQKENRPSIASNTFLDIHREQSKLISSSRDIIPKQLNEVVVVCGERGFLRTLFSTNGVLFKLDDLQYVLCICIRC